MYISLLELVHFFQQVCLAQAQECILEKSMLDNRKATIIGESILLLLVINRLVKFVWLFIIQFYLLQKSF